MGYPTRASFEGDDVKEITLQSLPPASGPQLARILEMNLQNLKVSRESLVESGKVLGVKVVSSEQLRSAVGREKGKAAQ